MSNYLIYPCNYMRITQSYTGTTSHKPHWYGSKNYKDYPIDEGGKDSGRSTFYCPCDEVKIVKIYGVGTSGVNTVWIESTSPVTFACGTTDYMTMQITHMEDADLKKLKVGQTFKRKQAMFTEGKDGATGYHFHISVGKGHITSGGWDKNSNGKWVLRTTGGTYYPQSAFFIDNSFTKVMDNKKLAFKTLPKETIYITTDNLNIRSGAGTLYKKVGLYEKGSKIAVTKTNGKWGYTSKGWVSLTYCKEV